MIPWCRIYWLPLWPNHRRYTLCMANKGSESLSLQYNRWKLICQISKKTKDNRWTYLSNVNEN